jgi:IS30 family transposase
MKHYQHLGNEERFYIWHALREGNTQQQIAEAIGRHPATVSRELQRNTYPQCHFYTS